MKLKPGFLVREVAGKTVVFPVGDVMDLDKMITLNETGGFLWKQLEKGAEWEELAASLCAEYEIDEITAMNHVEKFVRKLEDYGFLA